jgi:hypothetical protein
MSLLPRTMRSADRLASATGRVRSAGEPAGGHDLRTGVRRSPLDGISSDEIIGAVHRRRAPTMHASAGGAMLGCGVGEAQRGIESLIRAGQHVPATS